MITFILIVIFGVWFFFGLQNNVEELKSIEEISLWKIFKYIGPLGLVLFAVCSIVSLFNK